MSTFVKIDADPTTPLNTMPYIEKDAAIVRGVSKVLIDVSNTECYSGTGNIYGGTVLKNLVIGANVGGDMTATGLSTQFLRPISRGMISLKSAVGSMPLKLTANDAFGTNVTRSLVNFYFAFDGVGFTGNETTGFAGSGTGTGTSLAWAIYLYCSGGVIQKLQFRVRGTSQIDCEFSGSDLLALFDGTAHQYGFSVEIKNSVATLKIYVDGVEKASTSAAMTNYNIVASDIPAFNVAPGAVGWSSRNVNAFIGRMSLHDLTNRSDLSFTDILTKDRNAAAGYVS